MLEYSLRFLAGDRGVCIRGAWRHFAPQKLRGLVRRCSLDRPPDPSHHLVAKGRSVRGPGRSLHDRGAFALALYSWTVCVLLKKFLLSSWTATMAALIVWFAVALCASAALFQLS